MNLFSHKIYILSNNKKKKKEKKERERKVSHFGVKILTEDSFESIVTLDGKKLAQRRAFGFSPTIL